MRTLRESRYAMNSSANSGSWCRSRTVVSLSTRTTVAAGIAFAVDMRSGCPARQPSPKNVPPLQDGDDRLPSARGDDGERDLAALEVIDRVRRVSLREDDRLAAVLADRLAGTHLGEEQAGFEAG